MRLELPSEYYNGIKEGRTTCTIRICDKKGFVVPSNSFRGGIGNINWRERGFHNFHMGELTFDLRGDFQGVGWLKVEIVGVLQLYYKDITDNFFELDGVGSREAFEQETFCSPDQPMLIIMFKQLENQDAF